MNGLAARKLQEARFFLDKMRENYPGEEHFDYYFSAFTSAARSVLWVMRYEFGDVPGWRGWFEFKSAGEEVQKLLSVFTTLRNRSQKREPLQTFPRIEFVFPDLDEESKRWWDALPPDTRLHVTVTDEPESAPGLREDGGRAFAATLGSVYRIVKEFPEGDILNACREYLQWLEAIVEECLRRFPSPERDVTV